MKRSGKKSVEKSRQESHKQTSSQEFVSSDSPKQTSISKQQSAASGSTLKQESAASGSSSIKTQKQTLKQESAASGSSFTKTQKQTSIPEASENNGPFCLVELMPITSTAKLYRSNVHRELTPITRTTEPYRSNVRIAEPYRSNVRTAEPYRRELMPIIREPYRSNWTRDAEMKTILKTFLIELELKYNEKFTSESNDEILRQVIPRLIEAMKSRYTPRYRQVKSWLSALHKHRRVRLLYKQRGTLDKDNCHLH
ncbi:hypothetical protein RhiirC2_801238 [Rhizophagus irregularis]|uniref:Uncharacterized protein n=1 Tax=Rhizophagus irregularis TaxID=588596 RepID=A0A2N1M2M1_9GLOM|nr:hypothetical protein RhiirC2_801238 [Rhizophagus irregularis]